MSNITKIGDYLEANGWKREIAGAADFDAACRAIKTADEERKGLIVSGTFGVGKTMLVEIIARRFAYHWHRGFRMIHMGDPEEVEMLDPDWGDRWCEDLHDEVVLLDDVGAEVAKNEYGIITEPFATFVAARHKRLMRYVNDRNVIDLVGGSRAVFDATKPRYFDLRPTPSEKGISQKGARTPFSMMFATTNLNAATTDSRYGGRTLSRLKDFCVALHLTGEDKRKWNKPQTH